jgi:hypothetical protein
LNNDEPEPPGGGGASGGGESVGRDRGEKGDSNRGAAADGEAVCIQAALRVRPALLVTSAGFAAGPHQEEQRKNPGLCKGLILGRWLDLRATFDGDASVFDAVQCLCRIVLIYPAYPGHW